MTGGKPVTYCKIKQLIAHTERSVKKALGGRKYEPLIGKDVKRKPLPVYFNGCF
jgi:hypothetical protein